MNSALRSYLETAFWCETDNSESNGGEPLERNYTFDDIDAESLARQAQELNAFIELAENTIPYLLDDYTLDALAHDFWLTRNGHGAGFWDVDYQDAHGEILTKLAKKFSQVTPFVGTDNKIYFTK